MRHIVAAAVASSLLASVSSAESRPLDPDELYSRIVEACETFGCDEEPEWYLELVLSARQGASMCDGGPYWCLIPPELRRPDAFLWAEPTSGARPGWPATD